MWFILIIACSSSEDPAAANKAAEDAVESTARGLAEVSEALPDLTEEVTLVEGSYPGVGDCVWNYTVTGTPLAGDIDISLDTTPCGGAQDGRAARGEYTVNTGHFEGEFSASTAGWTVSLSGSQGATLLLEGSRNSAEADTSFELQTATATTDGASVEDWEIVATFSALADGPWELSASGADESSVQGTLTAPSGSACTLSGGLDDVQVACERDQ